MLPQQPGNPMVPLGTIMADLPDLARRYLVKAMDTDTKAAYRLVCRQARDDVCAATTRLTWAPGTYQVKQARHPGQQIRRHEGRDEDDAFSMSLPIALMAKCTSLEGLVCDAMVSLDNFDGLPAGLLHLNLSCIHFDHDRLSVAAFARCAPTLRELHLEANGLHIHGAVALAQLLPRLPQLLLLNVAGNDLCSEGIQALAQALPSLSSSLQHLDVRHNVFSDKGAAALALGLAPLGHLTVLKLADNHLGDPGIAALTDSIRTLTRLHHLDLDYNHFDHSCAEDLARMIEPLRELRTLNFWESRMHVEKSLPLLAPALAQLYNMQELSLRCSWEHHVLLKGMLSIVRGQPNLTSLQLSTEHMDEQDSRALACAMRPLEKLKRLTLYGALPWDDLTPVAPFQPLFDAIAQFTTLEYLDLCRNRYGAEGAAALGCHVLPRLQLLTYLDLSSNALGYHGAAALAPALGKLRALHTLHLMANGFQRSAMEVLAQELRGLPSLRVLDLTDNLLGKLEVQQLFLGLRV